MKYLRNLLTWILLSGWKPGERGREACMNGILDKRKPQTQVIKEIMAY